MALGCAAPSQLSVLQVFKQVNSHSCDFNLVFDTTQLQKLATSSAAAPDAAAFPCIWDGRRAGSWQEYVELYVQVRLDWAGPPSTHPSSGLDRCNLQCKIHLEVTMTAVLSASGACRAEGC